jgi:hypothetical protein
MKFNTTRNIYGNEFSFAPAGAWIRFGNRVPTVDTVGYYRAPLRG